MSKSAILANENSPLSKSSSGMTLNDDTRALANTWKVFRITRELTLDWPGNEFANLEEG